MISQIALFLLLTLPQLSTPTPSSDAESLLHFKSAADPHNLLPFTSPSHCAWPGVHCSPSRKVTRLILQNLPLGGVLSLADLDQLRVLTLHNTSLSGPIPDLSSLPNLKSLFLHHNSFSGPFPPSIASLRRLRTLDLSHNNLSGPIPAINQSTLLKLNVSGNSLFGQVPVTSVLTKFGPESFALNPGLCGEIVRRECRVELHSVGRVKRRRRNHRIVWFAAGVLALIAMVSLFCVTIAINKRRRQRCCSDNMEEKSGNRSVLIEVGGAEEAAAEVMRTEEEREEKVKNVVEGIKAAKSGSLMVFFDRGDHVQPYTVEELMRASAELMGKGTVGTTYKAVVEGGLMVCVKRVKVVAGVGKGEFARHMELVGGLRHPNLVPLMAFFHFQEKDERLLVYDYHPNGSLFSLIHGSKSTSAKPLHWTSCLKIGEDVAQGLSYLHKAKSLVHGNLKSSNVLLGSDFEARLTDYCLTILTEESRSSSGYLAPEMIHGSLVHEATPKSDVYAFGVLLVELLTGKMPPQHPYVAFKDMVRWMRSTRDDAMEEEEGNRVEMLLEVGIACRVRAPEKRPTMCQVLRRLQDIKETVFCGRRQ